MSSPARARTLLREVLETCGRRDWLDAAELALSELATNCCLHAHTDFQVRVLCGPTEVRVEVRDASLVVPQQRSYGPSAATGRGLALVAADALDHGTTMTEDGKIVWFTVGDRPAMDEELDADALLAAWGDDDLAPVPGAGAHDVRLTGFPPTLWLATMEMHDALLRELALFRTGRGLPVDDLAAADRARFALRAALDLALRDEGVQALARSPLPPGHPATLPEVPPTLDLELAVEPEASGDFALLQDVLDEANRLAAQGRFLTRPSLEEVTALRDWAAEQVISSLAGQEPMPWGGADAERFAQHLDRAERELDYDVDAVVTGARTAVVVDSANRILGISEPLAAHIGWRPEDLVGRRVVAIIPPQLREAHVAGFTRHLSTGQAHALRVDLQLPVMRADGSEVLCDFWIDVDRSRSGQSVYIAYVTPSA